MNRDLLTVKILLNHNLRTRVLKNSVQHYFFERGRGFVKRVAYGDTFSKRKSACLDDDRHTVILHISKRVVVVGEYRKISRGNACLAHELFRKSFRTFYLRGRFRRTPDAKSARLKKIDDARDQRIVHTAHCEAYLFFLCK